MLPLSSTEVTTTLTAAGSSLPPCGHTSLTLAGPADEELATEVMPYTGGADDCGGGFDAGGLIVQLTCKKAQRPDASPSQYDRLKEPEPGASQRNSTVPFNPSLIVVSPSWKFV